MKSFVQKVMIFAVVMLLVAAGGWLGRKAYRRAMQRSLLTEAGQYLEKKDYRNAALCLQRAIQINRYNVDTCRMMADMLEALDSPNALGWREQVFRFQPDNITNRFVWAQTAIKFKDFRSAATALRDTDEKSQATPGYHKLMGAMAWSLGNVGEAERHYLEAYRLDPTNQAIALNVATVHLASTNQAVADAARTSLEKIPNDSPLRSIALHQLMSSAINRKRFVDALGYSREIMAAPTAGFNDKIEHLELLRLTQGADYARWLASLKQDSVGSPHSAYALGRWMVRVNGATNALAWLHSLPAEVQTNQPVPILMTDCLLIMKDWNGILGLTEKQDWDDVNYYRFALQSYAQRSLGQTLAAENSWHKALRPASRQLARLASLTEVTARWGWNAERLEVLSEIMEEFPKETWVVDQIAGQLYTEGKTSELKQFFAKLYAKDSANVRLKNNVANLSLLQNTDLENSHRLAREAYSASTNDPFFASTYAYSLFLQKRIDEALKVMDNLKPRDLQNPSVAAYYGFIQAESGHKNLAREPLQRAAAANLLPEEMQMVRSAKAGL